jgi:hypothetical protein
MDFGTFLSDALASLLGGGVLLYAGYRFIDHRLRLRDQADRLKEREDQRKENLNSVLRSVHSELESNAAQLTTALKEVPRGAMIYPLFDTAMHPLVHEPIIFTTLQRETIQALTRADNRMKTVNDQNDFLSDLNHGPTAILAASTSVAALDDDRVKDTYLKFLAHRDAIREGVVERLGDLKPHIDVAIDAVEAELEMPMEQSASQRVYHSDTPVGYIGDPSTLPPPPRSGTP